MHIIAVRYELGAVEDRTIDEARRWILPLSYDTGLKYKSKIAWYETSIVNSLVHLGLFL